MKFQNLFIVTIAVILLSGCVNSHRLNFSVSNVGVSNKKINAELKSITVMIARPGEAKGAIDVEEAVINLWTGESGGGGEGIVPQMWQTALTEALNRMLLFQDDANKKVNLSVKILRLATPIAGLSMTTEVVARYEIVERKTGDMIYTQEIASSGTTPFSFSLIGAVRVRESINRAIQNNITQFLQALETVDVDRPMFPTKAGSTK